MKIDLLRPRFIKDKGEDKLEIIILIKGRQWIDTYQEVVIGIEDRIIQIDLSMEKSIEKGLNMFRIIEEETLRREKLKGAQNYRRPTFRREYRANHRNSNFDRGRSRSRDRKLSGNFRRNDRSSTRSRSGLRTSTNRDKIRCFRCREYYHFAKDCANVTVTEKDETKQMYQMLDSEEQETTLQVLTAETYDDLTNANLKEIINHLN